MGFQVVFADVDPVTWNISVAEVNQAITERTKTIVAVNYEGVTTNC